MLSRSLFILFLSCSTLYAQDFGWTISNSGTTSLGANVETDADGNVYVLGNFSDTVDLDPSANVAQLTTVNSVSETYLAKYDPAGNYLWSKKLIGVLSAETRERDLLAFDSHGNGLIAVNFEDSLVDLNGNVYYSSGGSRDIGILKFDNDGNQLWLKLAQGNAFEWLFAIQMDNQDHILLNGAFSGPFDIDFGPGTEIISPTGIVNDFILKLDETGAFEWVRTWDEGMKVTDMSADNLRNVWTTGEYYGTVDLDPSTGVFTAQNTTNNEQAFTLKLGSDGSFTWAKAFLSSVRISAERFDLNAQNEAIVIGHYKGTVQLDSETIVLPGNTNAYLMKLDENGTVVWARSIQCQGFSSIAEVKALTDGTIQFVGFFYDTIYFMGQNSGMQLIPVNQIDTYSAWYTSSGYLKWVSRFEGTGSVMVFDLIRGSADTIVMTGVYTGNYDFNLGPLLETETSPTYYHGFVKKMYFDPSISLGLEEQDEMQISYTNPVNDQLHYQSAAKIEKVSVYSTDGSLVRETYNPDGKIDFRGINSGLYLIHFSSQKGTYTARIIRL